MKAWLGHPPLLLPGEAGRPVTVVGEARPRATGPGGWLPGLLLALILLSAFYTLAGLVVAEGAPGVRATLGLTVNAGVVAALSLRPSRRQLPGFLLLVVVFSVAARLPDYPLRYAVVMSLANLPAIVVFRAVARRYACGLRAWGGRRALLWLLGCAAVAAAVSATGTLVLFVLAGVLGWLAPAHLPSLDFLFGTRLVAHLDGIAAVAPVMLTLEHRRARSWPWTTWAELGAGVLAMIVVTFLLARLPGAWSAVPLALLVIFAGMLVEVMRHGNLAAAVLTPAFALTAGVMTLGALPPHMSMTQLPGQLAGLVVAVLTWVVAVLVAERDAAVEQTHSAQATQEALTSLQRALLPADAAPGPQVSVASSYRAAGRFDRIGGDWYDTVELPGGGTALVIGDVEGHDLHAAAVMALVRGAVRSYALEGLPPSIILDRVSRFLVSAGSGRLVTMAYVQLYPDDTMATMAVAGHPEPLIVPPAGKVELDLRAGPLLGIEGLEGWQERTMILPPGTTLVLYTDGLMDFPAAPDDQLDRLVAAVAETSGEPLDRVTHRLMGSAPRYDDAAVLVARLTARPGSPARRRTFPAQPISAGLARVWLEDLFTAWQGAGLLPTAPHAWGDGAGGERLEEAQLLLTELLSNAVRHSDEAVTVAVRPVGERLRVEVEDASDRMPVLCQPEDAMAEGRGLRLVDALAAAWGAELVERGKVVWFEILVGTGPGPGHGPGPGRDDGGSAACGDDDPPSS